MSSLFVEVFRHGLNFLHIFIEDFFVLFASVLVRYKFRQCSSQLVLIRASLHSPEEDVGGSVLRLCFEGLEFINDLFDGFDVLNVVFVELLGAVEASELLGVFETVGVDAHKLEGHLLMILKVAGDVGEGCNHPCIYLLIITEVIKNKKYIRVCSLFSSSSHVLVLLGMSFYVICGYLHNGNAEGFR